VAAVEDQARQDVAKSRQQVADAVTGCQAAELRLADLELLLSQRQTQLEDLQQQREGLLRERSEAQQQSHALQQDLQALRLKAEQERVAQEDYIRGVEDRAHREVDHAREGGQSHNRPIQGGRPASRAVATAAGVDPNRAQPNPAMCRGATGPGRYAGAATDAGAPSSGS
jgi:uncharacterized protein (DUF3084 family)